MGAVKDFNGLNGAVVTRSEVQTLISQAREQGQPHLVKRLQAVLDQNENKRFEFEILRPEIEAAPEWACTDYGCSQDDEKPGLAKAVSPQEIYDMVTDRFIEALEKPLDWNQEWDSYENADGGYLIAYNFDSGKAYRGVNAVMLNSLKLFDPNAPLLENPFYLTFKQVEANGGKVRKGVKGQAVIYYIDLYKIELADRDIHYTTYKKEEAQSFAKEHGIHPMLISTIPILKYYIVFNGKDVTGIDFKLDQFKGAGYIRPKTATHNPNEPVEIAEAIVAAYPKPAPEITFGGDDALYNRQKDAVRIPKMSQFSYIQAYYTTLFHELIHSTGSPDRLARIKGKVFGDADYSFEELIAEIGASFLCAESGMLHYTFRNSAAYIQGWRANLIELLKSDNKFVFRASTAAQKATDFILDRDADGVAAYRKLIVQKPATKKTTKKPRATTIKNKIIDKPEPEGFAVKPKSIAVKTAIVQVLTLKKYAGIKPVVASILYKNYDPKKHEELQEDYYSEPASKFETSLLKQDSRLHSFYDHSNEISYTDLGYEFIQAVNGRLTSLRNQKHNYALFDGLKGKRKTTPGMNGADLAPLEIEVVDPTQLEATTVAKVENPSAVKPKMTVLEHRPAKSISKNPRVRNIAASTTGESQYYTINGEVGKFLQRVERKPHHSVVITLDGEQGAGKTTTLYKFMDGFASPGNKSLFLSLEEHPDSALAKEKCDKYLSAAAQRNIDTVAEVENAQELYDLVAPYDIIFLDSWQKLLRMVGSIRLDEDLRKRFDGKVFIVIFQQTTTGRTKGGAEVVFDGDIIIKMVKGAIFSENYAWFDKHRYTLVPTETIRYNIASDVVYNPVEPVKEPESFSKVDNWNIIIKSK